MEVVNYNEKEQQIIAMREDAQRQLAAIKTIDAGAEYLSKVKALEAYARATKQDAEIVLMVQEQKLRSMRILGKLLEETELNKGASEGGEKDGPRGHYLVPRDERPRLSDLGITKNESSAYQKIAAIPQEMFEQQIEEAKEQHSTTAEITTSGMLRLAQQVKFAGRMEDLQDRSADLPPDIFQVIYCDPAWQYSNSGLNGAAANHYMTMPTEEMAKIEVKGITDTNAVCFMWATNPLLKDAIWLMEQWGFEYKTNLVWVKNKSNYGKLGFYVYGQHELLLIGVKGSMLPTGDKPKSILYGDNSKHSKKPDRVYELIESMYPGLKYVELFSRNLRQGWTMWGNQINEQ